MKRDIREIQQQLEAIYEIAEQIGDAVDPQRKFTASREPERTLIRSADQISKQAKAALTMIKVTKR